MLGHSSKENMSVAPNRQFALGYPVLKQRGKRVPLTLRAKEQSLSNISYKNKHG